MHVLIVAGEELNPANTYSSVFELNQATALRKHSNIKCGFISIQLQGNFFDKLLGVLLLKAPLKSLFSFLKNRTVTTAIIEGFNCVEAVSYYVWSGKLKTKYEEEAIVGLRAFRSYVQQFGRPDIVHAHSRFLTGGVIAQAIEQQYQIPYVLTEHSTFYARGLATSADLYIAQSVINNAACWVCVSPQLGDTVTAMVQGLNKSYNYIPNVIDGLFETIDLSVSNEPSAVFKFINIASLDEKKGHSNLIRAFASRFKNKHHIQLLIAGSGPLKNSLKTLVKELEVEEQVLFLGQLNRNDIKACLQKSNAFVLSSIYETFGVVLIEALACGLPVIATACGGPENIVNSKNGYLIQPNDVDALSAAMEKMIIQYHTFSHSEIQEDCIARFGSASFAKQLEQVYQQYI